MLQRTRFAAALEVQEVLSPAQRQQLAAMNRQRLVNLRNYFQQGATQHLVPNLLNILFNRLIVVLIVIV
ncbi:hypothetical protein [Thermosynechococcus sp. CL-1]|uniref:hypothetical protein n=2 Tax=Thermosynechococcus TaxID=146785 RepID=UPI0016815ED3|nr:hypothetical protein [Thermosynechococcus sp. CL-1]